MGVRCQVYICAVLSWYPDDQALLFVSFLCSLLSSFLRLNFFRSRGASPYAFSFFTVLENIFW